MDCPDGKLTDPAVAPRIPARKENAFRTITEIVTSWRHTPANPAPYCRLRSISAATKMTSQWAFMLGYLLTVFLNEHFLLHRFSEYSFPPAVCEINRQTQDLNILFVQNFP